MEEEEKEETVSLSEESSEGKRATSDATRDSDTPSSIVRILMDFGIAKDEKTAGYMLLGIAVVLLAVAIFAFTSGEAPSPEENTSPTDTQPTQNENPSD